MNIFNSNIKQAFEPGENLCIDETLYSYRGRCPFKQYMPKKPAKYGIKINCVVDVETSYLANFEVYTGKSDPNNLNEKNLSHKLVLRLSDEYFNTNRCITMDNFFTSIPLAQDFYSKGLRLIGTIRANKVIKVHEK